MITSTRVLRVLNAGFIAVSAYTLVKLTLTMVSYLGDPTFLAVPIDRRVLRIVFVLTYGAFPAVACAASAWIAYTIIARLPERRDTIALATVLSSMAAALSMLFPPTFFNAAQAAGTWAPSQSNLIWAVGDWIAAAITRAAPVVLCGSYLRFTAMFPRAITPEEVTSRAARMTRLKNFLYVRVPQTWIVWPAGLALAAVIGVVAWLSGVPGMVGPLLFLSAGLANLYAGRKGKTADEQQRLRLIRFAILALMASMVLFPVGDAVAKQLSRPDFPAAIIGGPFVISAGVLAACVAIASAVFQKGAIDPALAIRRTAVYGALTGTAVFVFAGVEALLSGMLARGLGLSQGAASFMIAGVLALTFGAVRKKVGALMKRLLPQSQAPSLDNRAQL